MANILVKHFKGIIQSTTFNAFSVIYVSMCRNLSMRLIESSLYCHVSEALSKKVLIKGCSRQIKGILKEAKKAGKKQFSK